jgi:Helix-turn-helix domain
MAESELLDSEQLADLFHVTKQTIEIWRMEGRGPKFIRVGGCGGSKVLYHRSDVEAYLEANKHTGTRAKPKPRRWK